MEIKVDQAEIRRYLQYDNDIVDSTSQANIDKAIDIVSKQARCKFIMKKYHINIKDEMVEIEKTSLKFKSKALATHLSGCKKVMFVVATLGMELDYTIKKMEIIDIGLAYVINAVAVEYLEKYLDYLCENEIKVKYHQTSRFSIGYADLDLSYQSELINLLEIPKKIGVNVLETHLMVPSKSVSAIIGLSKEKTKKDLKKCEMCLDNGKCSGKCLKR